MLELFSFLLSLGSALKITFDTLKESDQKKLAKKLHQTHVQIQSIIDNAERIFFLINDASKQIDEYGEDKFSKILSDNFHVQFETLLLLAEVLQKEDLSKVFNKLDISLKKQLIRISNFKGDSIRIALQRMADSKFILKNKTLYIKAHNGKLTIAFPEFDEEIQRINDLKKCSRKLGKYIYSIIDLDDLL